MNKVGSFSPIEINAQSSIILANDLQHFVAGRALFREYFATLDFDISFQDPDGELRDFAQIYSSPEGAMLLVKEGSNYVGCAGIREQSEGVCELKRTYLQPGSRGKGLGKQLLLSCMEEARRLGYRQMVLDTHSVKMTAAIAMYKKHGFKEIAPYYYNPVPEARFYGREL